MRDILRALVNGTKRLLRSGRKTGSAEWPPDDSPHGVPLQSEIRLLVISASAREQNAIRVIAMRHGWKLLLADSVSSALTLLALEPAALILCDRDLPDVEWRDMFRTLLAAAEGQCVILVSPVTDDYLWQAVIEVGGYDVLSKPFQEEKVVTVVHGACLYRKAGWAQ
jgi:putative two-component system response regulator